MSGTTISLTLSEFITEVANQLGNSVIPELQEANNATAAAETAAQQSAAQAALSASQAAAAGASITKVVGTGGISGTISGDTISLSGTLLELLDGSTSLTGISQINLGSGLTMSGTSGGPVTLAATAQQGTGGGGGGGSSNPALLMFSYESGTLSAGQELFRQYIAGITLTLPQDLAGSVAYCQTAPAANLEMAITVNGTPVGSVNFAAGVKQGTFTLSAAQTISSGYISLVAPGTADTSFANPSVTLVGSR
jgi:hypothetical protein